MSKSTDLASIRKEALKELFIGLAVAAAGGLMTGISYNSARPGDRYTIFTGLIAIGVIYALHGLWRLILPRGLKGLSNKKDSSVQPSTAQEAANQAEEAEVIDKE